jgi:hypothetical protein
VTDREALGPNAFDHPRMLERNEMLIALLDRARLYLPITAALRTTNLAMVGDACWDEPRARFSASRR